MVLIAAVIFGVFELINLKGVPILSAAMSDGILPKIEMMLF